MAHQVGNQLSVYVGDLMHQRHDKHAYRFSYPYAVVCVDVDHWQEQCLKTGISVNRLGLFSLYATDFGGRNDQPWRSWLTDCLAQHQFSHSIHHAQLVAVPRFLGVGFNPLSMWYAFNEYNQLIAIIAEVSNTFGHWHHYVHHKDGEVIDTSECFGADKVFHVSPFLQMDLSYRFHINLTSETYRLIIEENNSNNDRVLTAVQTGKLCQHKTMVQCLWHNGLTSFGILLGIHWHAFKLWRKKARFYQTPVHLKATKNNTSRMYSC